MRSSLLISTAVPLAEIVPVSIRDDRQEDWAAIVLAIMAVAIIVITTMK
jgi:hypothetical protein